MAEVLLYVGTYISLTFALGWLITVAFNLFLK